MVLCSCCTVDAVPTLASHVLREPTTLRASTVFKQRVCTFYSPANGIVRRHSEGVASIARMFRYLNAHFVALAMHKRSRDWIWGASLHRVCLWTFSHHTADPIACVVLSGLRLVSGSRLDILGSDLSNHID